ncbi:ATP-binding protein [Clostridium sp. DL1XJH146]
MSKFSKKELYLEVLNNLDSLIVYRNILSDKLIIALKEIIENIDKNEFKSKVINNINEINYLLITNAENKSHDGNIFKKYIIDLILEDENTFSLSCENSNHEFGTSIFDIGKKDLSLLFKLTKLDLNSLYLYLDCNCDYIFKYKHSSYIEKNIIFKNKKESIYKAKNSSQFQTSTIYFYHKCGSGILSNSIAFGWDNEKGLSPIDNYHKIYLKDIVGYESQKNSLVNNTISFIEGKKTNNLLLEGARGTGKSSLVKALVNEYYKDALSIIEIEKSQLLSLNKVIDSVKNRGKKFIIYIDDLSFEETEIEYKQLKSILEGGLYAKPDNIIFYATSNRRHLVKEKMSDNDTIDPEIHTSDTINEKLSLKDRFGITLTFLPPNQKEYLEIVHEIATKRALNIDKETLEKEAITWELKQNGRSGRTAEQFVNYFQNIINN